jgi:hypothetical protein
LTGEGGLVPAYKALADAQSGQNGVIKNFEQEYKDILSLKP